MNKIFDFIKTPKGLIIIGVIILIIVLLIFNWNKWFGKNGSIISLRNGCICGNGTVHANPSTGNCANACKGLV